MNAKISAFGGGLRIDDGNGVAGAEGSLTLPVLQSAGLQIDGAYASVGSDGFGSTGAHLFWRDPSAGMLGLYAGYARLDEGGGADVGRAGVEAQAYLGGLTIDAAVGSRFVDIDDVYGRLRLQLYPIDDLMISAGFVYEGQGFGEIGAQYQIASSGGAGVALFGEGRLGEDDAYLALGGVRIFLGEDMTLINRHRRQDPDGYSGYDMQATQQASFQSRKPASGGQLSGGGAAVCPFTPAAAICDHREQCIVAGFTDAAPGPASCECVSAFDAMC